MEEKNTERSSGEARAHLNRDRASEIRETSDRKRNRDATSGGRTLPFYASITILDPNSKLELELVKSDLQSRFVVSLSLKIATRFDRCIYPSRATTEISSSIITSFALAFICLSISPHFCQTEIALRSRGGIRTKLETRNKREKERRTGREEIHRRNQFTKRSSF